VISVVTGVLAIVEFGDKTQFYVFAVTSLLSGLFLVFRLGYRNLELEEQAEPKIRVECGLHLSGCRTFNNWTEILPGNTRSLLPVCFYRVRVTADCIDGVKGCRAFLTKISFQGEQRWGDNNMPLTFEPGEAPDSTIKTINDKMEAFFDVVVVTSHGSIHMGTKDRIWPFDTRLSVIFATVGKYEITVLVTSPDTRSIKAKLQFNWTGQWNLSDLTLLDIE
jgi:hypothetical protein